MTSTSSSKAFCAGASSKLDQVVTEGTWGDWAVPDRGEPGRTAANNDVNMLRDFERQTRACPGGSISPKGDRSARRGWLRIRRVRIYKPSDGTLDRNAEGPCKGLSSLLRFIELRMRSLRAANDGTVRIYKPSSGALDNQFRASAAQEREAGSGGALAWQRAAARLHRTLHRKWPFFDEVSDQVRD